MFCDNTKIFTEDLRDLGVTADTIKVWIGLFDYKDEPVKIAFADLAKVMI